MTARRITNREIETATAARQDWKSNSAEGRNVYGGIVWETGRLATEHRELLRSKPVAYVVVSYSTPVAWVHVDGETVIPDARYSQTTSTLQNRLRRALAH